MTLALFSRALPPLPLFPATHVTGVQAHCELSHAPSMQSMQLGVPSSALPPLQLLQLCVITRAVRGIEQLLQTAHLTGV